MTKLFRQGIEAVETLSDEDQDFAGKLLLEIATSSEPKSLLTPEQIEDLKLAIAEADRGEFVSEEEMEDVWRSFGK